MTQTTSRSQLRRREAGWEGRRRRNRDPRNTNRIEGGAVWASRQYTAKPVVIKGPSRRCGGCAGKVAVLIRGDLPGCRPRRKSPDRGRRKAAGHPAGVSRGRSSGGDRAPRRAEREAEAKRRPCSRKPQQPTQPRRGLRAMDAQGEARSSPRRAKRLPGARRGRASPRRRPGTSGRSSSPARTWPRRSDASSKTPVPPASTA